MYTQKARLKLIKKRSPLCMHQYRPTLPANHVRISQPPQAVLVETSDGRGALGPLRVLASFHR